MAVDDDERPGRALLVAVAAMAGVAVVVGLVVAGVVVGAFNETGLGKSEVGSATDAETLYMPRYSPSNPARNQNPKRSSPKPTQPRKPTKPVKVEPPIKLFVAPQKVAPGERINLNGVYDDGAGATLQVQRKESGMWVDFPVTAPVTSGSFETWILTSHTGRNLFRMYDKEAHRASNVVGVQVG